MSKNQAGAPWDGREAFHLATMTVYADLGALIAILQKEPDLRVALLALDGVTEHRAPEPWDTELIGNLKHVVGHLLESLNTVEDVRKAHPRVGSTFWRGREIDRTWGAISPGSHHQVAISAAKAMLEPDAAGAAESGREPPAGGASGILRQKVIEAAMDTEAWARLAENLAHEYRSASLLPHPPAGDPKPAAGSIEGVQTQHPEKVDFVEALERYGRSCDEMRTLRVNPLKAIPLDQWSGEMRRRGTAIDRIQQEYARYVLRIADENERHADQARTWWAWWEKTQVEPSKAGLAPLVSPNIEVALRAAAAQRRARSPTVGRAAAQGAISQPDKAAADARFRRTGADHWDVALHGQQAVVADSKGMGYLQTLLSSPNAPVHSWTLANGTPPPADRPLPVVDDETLDAIRNEIGRKEAERSESQDLDQRAALESQIEDLRRHLSTATKNTGGGRREPRRQRDEKEQMRESVGKGIQRALAVLIEQCPVLGEHLTAHIKNPTGMTPSYVCSDEERPQWLLEDQPPPGSDRAT